MQKKQIARLFFLYALVLRFTPSYSYYCIALNYIYVYPTNFYGIICCIQFIAIWRNITFEINDIGTMYLRSNLATITFSIYIYVCLLLICGLLLYVIIIYSAQNRGGVHGARSFSTILFFFLLEPPISGRDKLKPELIFHKLIHYRFQFSLIILHCYFW